MDVRLNIYKVGDQDLTIRYVAEKWDFSDTYMGERYITFTASSSEPIDWQIGDFLIYRGLTFYLNNIPSCTQSAGIDESGDAFVYDNVKFDDDQGALYNCMVLDITPTTGDYVASEGTNYTGSSVFTIYCAETTVKMQTAGGVWEDVTLSPVAYVGGVIQANLNRLYPRDGWRVDVNPALNDLDDKVISFSKWYVPQALAEIHNQWDVDFIVIGRTIRIGYTLNNVTGDDDSSFLFGYGMGYSSREDDGKSLFKIKKTANSSQRIITRLRAIGSTRNMPYRYYNKHYSLPQSMFVSNLQLPDTFEVPSVKELKNTERDNTYGFDGDGYPLMRHVLGDTNDAYIDKYDDATRCVEGIREGAGFWDGSDSELEEIYPTIQSGTYLDLRGALIPDIDGATGRSAYPNYGDYERIDEILDIDEQTTNIGDGVVAEADASSQQEQAFNVAASETSQTTAFGEFYGTERTLFTTTEVSSGKYMMAASEGHVKFHIAMSSASVMTCLLGFRMKIYQVPSDGTAESLLGTYTATATTKTSVAVTLRMPDLPDVQNVDIVDGQTQVSEISVTKKGNVRVTVQPVAFISGTVAGNYTVTYSIDSDSEDVEPRYVWSPTSATDLFANQPFYIFIKDIGIDMKSLQTTGDDATIHFNTGQCGGMEFKFDPNVAEEATIGGKKGWKLLITERYVDDTLHVYYPNSYNRILAGDRYVLLNIEFPQAYIKIAELRLLDAATKYLADNSETKFTYEPEISDIYLQQNIDRCIAENRETESVYWNLYAGYKFSMRGIPSTRDEILPVIDNITIKTVSIKEGYNEIPQVEIVLNDEVEQSTIQKLTVSVDRIYNSFFGSGSGSGNGGSSVNYSTLISLLNSEGGKKFLSKLKADTAQGVITFLAGLLVGNWNQGNSGASIDAEGNAEFNSAIIRKLLQALKVITDTINSSDFYKGQLGGTGWGIYDDSNGYSTMEIDNLIVRMKAIFAELEIRKMSYVGGDYIFSAAGSKIAKVQYLDANQEILAQTIIHPLTDAEGNVLTQDDIPLVWREDVEVDTADIAAFRCYIYSDDGTTQTMNWWQVGDQARCQTFNIQEGVYENVANRFYWRLVTGTGSATLEDGKTYNYVDLSNIDYAGATGTDPINEDEIYRTWANDYPAPGDAIVQLGNRADNQRKNAIEIIVEGDAAPAFIEYKGIDDYNLASHRMTVLSPNGDEIVARKFSMLIDNSIDPMPRERGAWSEDATYEYYDRVSHDGSLWLMISQTPVTGADYEPSESLPHIWLKQVASGTQGPAGVSSTTMMCSPNPVMIDTDMLRQTLASGSAAVSVSVIYGTMRQAIQTISISYGDNTGWTANANVESGGNGKVYVYWDDDVTIVDGTIDVSATIANPLGGSPLTATGSFVISPNKKGYDGTNGRNSSQVYLNPETYYIETDSSSYPRYNVEDAITFQVLNWSGTPLELVSAECEFEVTTDEGRVAYVGVHGISGTTGTLDVFWRSTYPVDLGANIPITVEYIDNEVVDGERRTVKGLLSIRDNRQGNNGESAYYLTLAPSTIYVPVDEDDLCLADETFEVDVRGYVGSQQTSLGNSSIGDCGNLQCTGIVQRYDTIDGTRYYYDHVTFIAREGSTFDGQSVITYSSYVNTTLVKGNIVVVPLRKGDRGTSGRGIASVDIAYAASYSGNDIPDNWSSNRPVLQERQYLWVRTTITYTDGSDPDVSYSISYIGADGDDGTSFTVKGKAYAHAGTVVAALALELNERILVDEGRNGETAILDVTNYSTSAYTQTLPETGDGYLTDSSGLFSETDGHLWIASDDGWVDAGQIKGEDGTPAYVHYAWANSSTGYKDFTTNKQAGENFIYMGVLSDHTPLDSQVYTDYTWNQVKGTDGDKGTTVLGEAIAYYNDISVRLSPPSSLITKMGNYLVDFSNWDFRNGEWVYDVGNGCGPKVFQYSALRPTYSTFSDPKVSDSYTIGSDLYSFIGVGGEEDDESGTGSWQLVVQGYVASSAYLHYAWAHNLTGKRKGIDWNTTKGVDESFEYMGFYSDDNESDSDNFDDYEWTLIKGEDGDGIESVNVSYNIGTSGTSAPEGSTAPYGDMWYASIEELLNAHSLERVPSLMFLWTRTIITYTGGLGSTTSYSVAYQGYEGKDGRSVTIRGTLQSESDLPGTGNAVGDGYIIDGNLWIWDGSEWQNVGKFSGDDGQSSYMHIAWANSANGEDDFSTTNEEGDDYYYMGVCVNFEPIDPDYPSAYSWNKIKGAEGRNGTEIKGRVLAHLSAIRSSIAPGLYAIDSGGTAHGASNPAWLGYYQNSRWTSVSGIKADGTIEVGTAPDEGDGYLDQDDRLWSFVEGYWVDLGVYSGNSAYLHLAWANSADGSQDFTVSKTTTADYMYVGFYSDNVSEDIGYKYGEDDYTGPDHPWTYYSWKRLRGTSPGVIELGTDLAVVDADNTGRISSLSNATGLPYQVKLLVDGSPVPLTAWTSATMVLNYQSGATRQYALHTSSTPTPVAGISPSRITASLANSNPISAITWAYSMEDNAHPVITLKEIVFTINATYQGFSYTATKAVPVLLNKEGASSTFQVQYSAGPDANNEYHWHDVYQEGDKWMRIFQDGEWSLPMKIVADEMSLNIKGEAIFHAANLSDAVALHTRGTGLVDVYSSLEKHAVVTFSNTSGAHTYTIADVGDGYIMRNENDSANGHLFIATEDGWSDIGQVAGANGQDAIVASLTPPTVILNQDIDTRTLGNISVRVVVTKGASTVSGFTAYVLDSHQCSASLSGSTMTVVPGTYESSGSTYYYDQGYVEIAVSYSTYYTQLKFHWYANLLGTWKETIMDGVRTEMANKVTYEEGEGGVINCYDDNHTLIFSPTDFDSRITQNTNGITTAVSDFNQTASAITGRVEDLEGDYTELQETANGLAATIVSQNGRINTMQATVDGFDSRITNNTGNIATLSATASSLTSTITNLQVGSANLFSFSECAYNVNSNTNVPITIPYIQGYGIEGTGTLNRISKLGFNGKGGKFVVTCEMRMQTSAATINVNICDVSPIIGKGSIPSGSASTTFSVGTSWVEKTLVFNIPDTNSHISGTYNGFLDFESSSITSSNRLYVRKLKVERGEAPTAFCISDKDEGSYIPEDILTFNVNDDVAEQSDKYRGYKIYKLNSEDFPVTVNEVSSELNMFTKGDLTLKKNTCYTLSFFAKSSAEVLFGCLLYGETNPVNGTINGIYQTTDTSNPDYVKSGEMTAYNRGDGGTFIRLTSSYKRYVIHWYVQNNSGTKGVILGRLNSSWQNNVTADVYVTGIEFREGYWTDGSMNSQSMIHQTANEIEMRVNNTGINIEDGSITLNSERTTIVGDLNLLDSEQGLVLYGGGNIERVSVKGESIGNLADARFGGVRRTRATATANSSGTVSLDSVVIGTVTNGEPIACQSIYIGLGIYGVSGTGTYTYIVKCGTTTLKTQTGSATYDGYGFKLTPFTGTANATGNLTLTLSFTASFIASHSVLMTTCVETTNTGLNKIGSDGAVFANSATHYNWFGPDLTEIRNGGTSISIDSEGAWYSPSRYSAKMELGSSTRVVTPDVSSGSWTAPLSAGVIAIFSLTGNLQITLPRSWDCLGKIYYVKNLSSRGVTMVTTQNDVIFSSDSNAENSNVAIGGNSTMFVSVDGGWIYFYCS